MYSDPTKLRSHVVKLRFSDEEERLIRAYVDYTGEQTATRLRELVLEAAASSLGVNGSAGKSAFEVTHAAQNWPR